MSADSIAVLKQDVTRSLTIYLMPGFVAAWPFIQTLQLKFPDVGAYLRDNSEVLILTYILVSYIVGLILEDVGSNIESWYSDRVAIRQMARRSFKNQKSSNKDEEIKTLIQFREEQRAEFDDVWNKFMRLSYGENSTPVGHRALRNVVLRLKFELSMGLAILIFVLGLTFLNNYVPFEIRWYYVFGSIGLFAFLVLFESQQSIQTLHKLRKELTSLLKNGNESLPK